jgi:ATP-dependent DNA ligase
MLLRRVAFPDFCEACLPSPAARPPAGVGWLHEIKHDGFRMLVRRDAVGVRLFTRNGHDWTGRFPLIARAALCLKAASCLIDGEAVACDDDGLPVFDRLRYRRQDTSSCLPSICSNSTGEICDAIRSSGARSC